MLESIKKLGQYIEAADLGGWMLVIAAIGIISVATLVPAWMDLEQIRYQHDLLAAQLEQNQAYHANFVAFNEALDRNDPLLLERLAWRELHLKSVNTTSLDFLPSDQGLTPRPPVDVWLLPRNVTTPVSPPYQRWQASRLMRIGSNATLILLIIGGLLAIAGLVSSLRQSTRPIENRPDDKYDMPEDADLIAEIL